MSEIFTTLISFAVSNGPYQALNKAERWSCTIEEIGEAIPNGEVGYLLGQMLGDVDMAIVAIRAMIEFREKE